MDLAKRIRAIGESAGRMDGRLPVGKVKCRDAERRSVPMMT